MTGAAQTTAEARAARRGGVLALVLMPIIAIIGVVLLALSSVTPVFIPAGVTLIVLAVLAILLGVVAVRRSGPVAGLRNAAAIVAVVGMAVTVIVGITLATADDGGTSVASAIGLAVLIVATWALTHLVAGAIRKAERAARA